jgi:hypothetical protein
MSVKQANPLAFGSKTPIGQVLEIENTTPVALASGTVNNFQTLSLDVGTYMFYHTIVYTSAGSNATGVFISSSNTFDGENAVQLFNATIPTANTLSANRSGFFTVTTAGNFVFSTTAIFAGGGTLTRTEFFLKLVKIA